MYRGSLLVRRRRRPLFESSDPYFETDEVLGKFRGRAQLHQLLYTLRVTPSLGLCYLLRAFGGYGVKIVHGNSLPGRPSRYYPLFTPFYMKAFSQA